MANTLDATPYIAGVAAAKIYPLTADPLGGSATYGSGIIIPGVSNVTATPKTTQKDLNGDNQLLQSIGFTNSIDLKIDFSEFSFDAWPLFTGGVATSTGTDPNGVRQLDWSLERGGLFKLELQCTYVTAAGGDLHAVYPRCNVITPPPKDYKFQDFTTYSVMAVAYRSRATGIAESILYNGTVVALT